MTFLEPRADDPLRFDLWGFEIESGVRRRLVDADRPAPREIELSNEERGRRERQRITALDGIVEYDVAPDGRRCGV